MEAQVGEAFIVDNRDGTVERVVARGPTIPDAAITAYVSACVECQGRNSQEPLPWRFVPLRLKSRRETHVQ